MFVNYYQNSGAETLRRIIRVVTDIAHSCQTSVSRLFPIFFFLFFTQWTWSSARRCITILNRISY